MPTDSDHTSELGCLEDMPCWLIDNEYLKTGYRRPQTFLSLTKSLFGFHNQTMNVWTHLFAAFFFFGLFFWILSSSSVTIQNSKEIKATLNKFHFETQYQKMIETISQKVKESDLSSYRSLHDEHFKEFVLNFVEQSPELQPLKQKLINFSSTIRRDTSNELRNTNSLDSITNCNVASVIINQFSDYASRNIEKSPVYIFIVSAIVCLVSSSAYHLYAPLSPKLFLILRKMDYLGIIQHISVSSFTNFYYFYYCDTFLRNIYLGLILSISVAILPFTILPTFEGKKHKKLRTFLFSVLGFSNFIPGVHGVSLAMTREPESTVLPLGMALTYLLLMVGCYSTGIFFYASRFPERKFPKKFDVWFNSHTIWHIFTFLGMISCWMTIQNLIHDRIDIRCGLCQ